MSSQCYIGRMGTGASLHCTMDSAHQLPRISLNIITILASFQHNQPTSTFQSVSCGGTRRRGAVAVTASEATETGV